MNLINRNKIRIWGQLICERQRHNNSFRQVKEIYCCKLGHNG